MEVKIELKIEVKTEVKIEVKTEAKIEAKIKTKLKGELKGQPHKPCLKNAGSHISMFFTSNEYSTPMAIRKIT